MDDLLHEVRETVARGERVLVTTLTKRMAEELTNYYRELGVRVKYLHSDIVTIERMQILRDLRMGEFDVLVGINLLREGLDLPEVSLVAILDADKEGFLRSARSLIQTCGRAARNINGRVLMYADRSPARCRPASTRPNAVAPSSWPRTPSTASRPRRSRRVSATSWSPSRRRIISPRRGVLLNPARSMLHPRIFPNWSGSCAKRCWRRPGPWISRARPVFATGSRSWKGWSWPCGETVLLNQRI